MASQTIVEALQSMFGGATTTIIGATIGRLMWHTSEVKRKNRRFISLDLIWELPVAFGMGIFGEGASSYFDLDQTSSLAVIAALAYLGPRGIEVMLCRWFASKKQ
jgi:hypothetical protein